jgi:Mycothiol maleylpyruvate isomerase N-terminal domain
MSAKRPVEAEQILAALEQLGPTPMTSCPGWSAHHVAAHITGNYQEVRRHVEGFAAGQPVDRTRDWDEREAPLRELDHGELLALLEREEAAMRESVAEALDEHGDSTLRWAGRTVRLAGFLTHMRSENAVHRWDLVGDDHESATLLGNRNCSNTRCTLSGNPCAGVDSHRVPARWCSRPGSDPAIMITCWLRWATATRRSRCYPKMVRKSFPLTRRRVYCLCGGARQPRSSGFARTATPPTSPLYSTYSPATNRKHRERSPSTTLSRDRGSGFALSRR